MAIPVTDQPIKFCEDMDHLMAVVALRNMQPTLRDPNQ